MIVEVLYTNYKGETSRRKILPIRLYFGSNEWHPDPQWILEVLDQDKQEVRYFAMKDIVEWEPIT